MLGQLSLHPGPFLIPSAKLKKVQHRLEARKEARKLADGNGRWKTVAWKGTQDIIDAKGAERNSGDFRVLRLLLGGAYK